MNKLTEEKPGIHPIALPLGTITPVLMIPQSTNHKE
jgi:hypothetical protein